MTIEFKPTPTQTAFMQSTDQVRLLAGPIGSGKTTCVVCTIAYIATNVIPVCADGKRRSRWAVIRNTAQQLKDTTVPTFKNWFPEGDGVVWRAAPDLRCIVTTPEVEIEILFRALDKEDDIGKLLSLDLTGAFHNELREQPLILVNHVFSRCGRFPSAVHRPLDFKGDWGASHKFVLADTNPPDEESDLRYVMQGYDPEFKGKRILLKPFITTYWQPPAVIKDENEQWVVNPNADNLDNVGVSYYKDLIERSPESFVKVMLANMWSTLSKGDAVHDKTFDSEMHVRPSEYDATKKLLIGMDFGRTPAAVFGQMTENGRLQVIAELQGNNIGLREFLQNELLPMIDRRFRGADVQVIGDPAGVAKMQGMNLNLFDILEMAGIPAVPAWSNDPGVRIGEVDDMFSKLVGGKPCLSISPECALLIDAMAGGYKFGKTRMKEYTAPVKNEYSHIADALQYLVLGCKMVVAMRTKRSKPPSNPQRGLDRVFV